MNETCMVPTSGSVSGSSCCSPEGSRDDPPPAQRGAGRPDSLPCQYSNNSIQTESKLSAYQRKNAYSINENINHAVQKYGVEKIGFLTLTFPKSLILAEANRRFNSLASNFLNSCFLAWVCVREFTKSGRPHFHLIVVCNADIRTGFNFENYVEMSWMSSNPRRRHKFAKEIKQLSRSLNPSHELRSLWRDFHRVLPEYKFGRHELIPIRKNGAALARYIGGYIRKSMEFRPVEAKGARLITYSKSFPRKIVGHQWAFHTIGSELWRRKVALFADLHGIEDMEGLKTACGPRWAWWFKDVIESLNLIPTALDGPPEILAACMQDLPLKDLPIWKQDEGLRNFDWLHVRQPKFPEVDGNPCKPSADLVKIFSFHMNHWRKSRQWHEEFHAETSDAASSLATRWEVQIVTDKIRAEARALDLQSARHTPASERARNYTQTCHPSYPLPIAD